MGPHPGPAAFTREQANKEGYSNLTDAEAGPERLSNILKVTHPASGEVGTRARSEFLPLHYHLCGMEGVWGMRTEE